MWDMEAGHGSQGRLLEDKACEWSFKEPTEEKKKRDNRNVLSIGVMCRRQSRMQKRQGNISICLVVRGRISRNWAGAFTSCRLADAGSKPRALGVQMRMTAAE
jgi:hypothetical protein